MSELTLGEYLKSISPEKPICIGTVGGHNYLFFGMASDIETINKIFESYREKAMSKIQKIDARLSNSKNMSDHTKLSCLKTRAFWQNMHDNYIPPLNRKIVDRYNRLSDEYEAIIIEGVEYGEFWTQAEYDKKYPKAQKPIFLQKDLSSADLCDFKDFDIFTSSEVLTDVRA